jgi:hypothetical protein
MTRSPMTTIGKCSLFTGSAYLFVIPDRYGRVLRALSINFHPVFDKPLGPKVFE